MPRSLLHSGTGKKESSNGISNLNIVILLQTEVYIICSVLVYPKYQSAYSLSREASPPSALSHTWSFFGLQLTCYVNHFPRAMQVANHEQSTLKRLTNSFSLIVRLNRLLRSDVLHSCRPYSFAQVLVDTASIPSNRLQSVVVASHLRYQPLNCT